MLDIGCGTGVLAPAPAERGTEVVGVDPAAASLDVARGKPGGERVRWIHGDATRLPPLAADLATITGNAAQEIVDPQEWRRALRGARAALRPGGRLVVETRIPARRAWEEWNREATYGATDVPGVGVVETWVELLDVSGPLVTFRWTYVFAADGQTLTRTRRCAFASGWRSRWNSPLRVARWRTCATHPTGRAGSSCSSHDARIPVPEAAPPTPLHAGADRTILATKSGATSAGESAWKRSSCSCPVPPSGGRTRRAVPN